MPQYSRRAEVFVNLLIVAIVLVSWASICLIIWTLCRWHCPLWVATVVGIPIGFLTTGAVFLGVLYGCSASGRLKESAFLAEYNDYIEKASDAGELRLLNTVILPTLLGVILTVVLVPLLVKERAATRAEANQRSHVQASRNVNR